MKRVARQRCTYTTNRMSVSVAWLQIVSLKRHLNILLLAQFSFLFHFFKRLEDSTHEKLLHLNYIPNETSSTTTPN